MPLAEGAVLAPHGRTTICTSRITVPMSTPLRYSRTRYVTTATCWMSGTHVRVPVNGSNWTAPAPPVLWIGCGRLYPLLYGIVLLLVPRG